MSGINDQMVNIGSKESPMLVPKKALETKTSGWQEWWEMVANGSVTLEPEVLDRLLELTKDEGQA